VTLVTDPYPATGDSELLRVTVSIKSGWIAGPLLVTVFQWAIVVPLSGRTLVTYSTAVASTSHLQHVGSRRHSCCPQVTGRTVIFVPTGAPPCGDQHRCCFSSAPDVPPGLLVNSTNSRVSGYIHPVAAIFDMVAPCNLSSPARSPDDVLRRASSTVLRI